MAVVDINEFAGKYAFLSNFYPSKISYHHEIWDSVEHLFQALKTKNENQRDMIRMASSPGGAKRLGRKAELRSDWEQIKIPAMEMCLRKKFLDPKLRMQLIQTGYAHLREGNTWGDQFWGVSLPDLVGENHLGLLLMKIRSEFQEIY